LIGIAPADPLQCKQLVAHKKQTMRVVLLCWITLLLAASALALKHTSVKREVQIAANVEKIKLEIALANTESKPQTQYKLLLTPDEDQRLSYALALFNPNDETVYTELEKQKTLEKGYVVYLLKLSEPLQTNANTFFHIRLALTHPTHALPEKVSQNDPVYVRYKGNAKFYSPYETQQLSCEFNLGTSDIKSFLEPASTRAIVSGEAVSYNWGETPAFSNEYAEFHFKADKPFITFRQVIREIEISQWGNVAIEEQYEVENTAAKFTGGFSRLDYQLSQNKNSANNFESFTAILPPNVAEVYYRDHLGNVTTSNFRSGKKSSILELRTRFPLMPSWKADFYIGYHISSEDMLFTDPSSGKMVLESRFGTPFRAGVIDELIVRVILPEGASAIESEIPFEHEASPLSHRLTYLDTTGRPVLEFKKRNVVQFHNKVFQVSYAFPSFYILREPLYLIAGVFSFFLAAIVYARLASSLGSNETLHRRKVSAGQSALVRSKALIGDSLERVAALLEQSNQAPSDLLLSHLDDPLREIEESSDCPDSLREDVSSAKKLLKSLKQTLKKKEGISATKLSSVVSDLRNLSTQFLNQ
jgi:oligosaccharyltransferase complex subunit alpha (ribophorin I)